VRFLCGFCQTSHKKAASALKGVESIATFPNPAAPQEIIRNYSPVIPAKAGMTGE
jgi:hypothetical protein